MKILLTGATGFLGFRTLEVLAKMPTITSIVATGRTLKPTHQVDHPKVDYQLGDLASQAFTQKLVSQVDHIIHAAALSAPWGNYQSFETANVLTQQNLIKAAHAHPIQRFVYISTPSIYYNGQDRLNVSEADPLPSKFVNAYAATKRLAEVALEQSNIPYVILRPRALIGRGDTVIMPRLLRAYEAGRLKIIGHGQNLVDLTAVANVAQAIVLSLQVDHQGLNQVYNITNGEPVYLWQKIQRVLELMGKQLPAKKIPYALVSKVAQLMEWRAKLTNGQEPTLTKYGVGTLAKSFTLDISKAKKLLGYVPKITTDEAIQEFVSWYQQNQ
ncbi:MAG TPA: sterol-4-alpha-carboxylate 3-dehydrogenase [Microscillaceae bacterium]|nr:sterol-4-alpha-carboxylate 3-dehydrogenase [Microscillaceae bacterium]